MKPRYVSRGRFGPEARTDLRPRHQREIPKGPNCMAFLRPPKQFWYVVEAPAQPRFYRDELGEAPANHIYSRSFALLL